MPPLRDEGGSSTTATPIGAPTPAPVQSPSTPTLPSGPTVSNTPGPGQVPKLDAGGRLPASAVATALRMLTADPTSPMVGEFWYRTDTSQFCVRHDSSTTKRVTLA